MELNAVAAAKATRKQDRIEQAIAGVEALATARGVQLVRCGMQGHIKLIGNGKTVCYWPASPKQTAYIEGKFGSSYNHVTPEQAIAMLFGDSPAPTVAIPTPVGVIELLAMVEKLARRVERLETQMWSGSHE